jgi:hypothetical protein
MDFTVQVAMVTATLVGVTWMWLYYGVGSDR